MSFVTGDLRNFFGRVSVPIDPSATTPPDMRPTAVSAPPATHMQQGNASAQGGSARARVSATARASATRGRGRVARGRPRNVQRTSRGNALVDDAASLSGEDNGQEEIEDEENDRDRAFVDDDEQSMSSSVNGYRAPSENRFARDGPRVSYDPEEPKTKKERRMPRVL